MGKGYSPSMRRLALLLFLAFFWLPLQAAQLAVVLGGEEGAYREFLGTLKGAVGGSDWQVSWEGSSEKFQQAPPAGVDLIVAVGSQAARVALARADGPPVIATLLTRSAYETVRAESPTRRSGITALYLDQPLQRQIAFIQRLLPDNRRVMTVVSDKLADQLPQLKRLGNAAKLSVDTAVLNTGDSLVPVLERVLGQEGVYLALPDSVLYSRDNIRPFLLTTYRYQRPVVAFSAAFVQAGALAALHTTPAQLALEVAQWINRQRPGTLVLPPAQGPSRFSVVINTQVARSFKLTLPGEDEILSSLSAAAGEKP